ncbi:PPOX class F420-dependent oxidoreductase [Streptomyces qinzhouensis]|uniref:PPOX class F420-dependent oxidoreductase n=1 Tax=Streptomyces qinzhouensis TaxID=2599401 RepID=A0A5B8IMC6_9ACTN|nr:PPOX class F420-dependent oxidoreductase [Streptomyces qinzhouensis]QDY79752.1 PPOX class F420-dependent oxidoreductase [Streptomyces qinzhouensis]
MTAVDDIAPARYLSLTTFRRDGTGVATPVWFAEEGGRLYVWTNRDSWKVKRLRRDSRVTVAVCDARGRIADGAPHADGTAEVLDGESAVLARDLVARKYGWQFRAIDWPARLARRGKRPHAGIVVTVGESPATA